MKVFILMKKDFGELNNKAYDFDVNVFQDLYDLKKYLLQFYVNKTKGFNQEQTEYFEKIFNILLTNKQYEDTDSNNLILWKLFENNIE